MKAFVTGITGQDGAYLAEFLLAKGYEVHGLMRRSSSFNTGRIDHLRGDERDPACRFFLHYGDMTDGTALLRVLERVQPDEIYNLAAQSHVAVSFETPEYTANADALGTLRLLEAARTLKLPARIYQAGTSEMFGSSPPPQNETTPFRPRSPYGCAKLYAHWIAVNYREAYGLHVCNGILFNHESPIRGEAFVSRKIAKHVARVARRNIAPLYLGNLDAVRDWGHAKDYVRGMWLMLQHPTPDDYVLATGQSHTVRDMVDVAFGAADIPLSWIGEGLDEVALGISGEVRVKIDPRYFRPTEVDALRGDASKAKDILGWEPTIDMRSLVREMVAAEMPS